MEAAGQNPQTVVADQATAPEAFASGAFLLHPIIQVHYNQQMFQPKSAGGNLMAMTTEAPAPAMTNELTYDGYMAEPIVRGRYDVVQGVRVFQPESGWRRQCIIGHFAEAFSSHKRRHNSRAVSSFDLLICRAPLQIRQPDILLISHDRLTAAGGPPKIGPLETGPELVVEIVMDGQSEQVLRDKVADYQKLGVNECWVVRPDDGTVEVLSFTRGKARSFATYGEREIFFSLILSGLSISIADVFAD